ncbi:MAG: protein tyrosine phosphatase-like domain-containing protein [Flavobacteriales bacterium]|nr:protein tyrosine phosphatase-like domain-containing protein [Flavobacteriales bacterium]
MKKAWLISFNIITLIAWALFFFHAALHGLQVDAQSLYMLALAQGLAIFEVMNAVIGIAGANWLLTAMQVFSRFLIAGLLLFIPFETLVEIDSTLPVTGFALISIAWSITEIVRALYYLTDLFKKEIKAITFSRYTFFILLYPMGVTGEFLVMYAFWKWREFAIDPINIILAGIALSYFVFFPKLYGHMWKQRKKKLA